jgi:hypothetical protein
MNIHPKVIENLSKLDCATARRALKRLWCTHGEADELIRFANCKKNPPVSAAIRICYGYDGESPFLIY